MTIERGGTARTLPGRWFEPLESRAFLSAAAPPTGWPTAPFHRREYRDGTWLYVNQFGYAKVSGQFDAQHQVAGYDLFFDDGGSLRATATGATPVDLAYYPDAGAPTLADASGNAAGAS